MRDSLSWNLPLGQWAGVRVRLHASFLFFGVLVLYLTMRGDAAARPGQGLLFVALWLAAVVLHEAGHFLAARRLGAELEAIALTPLGNIPPYDVASDPREDVATALAGPVVSFLACLALTPALVAASVEVPPLLNPFRPVAAAESLTWTTALAMAFWANWTLALLTLAPGFPFDGGRALCGLLRPKLGSRTAVLITARTGTICSIAALLAGWVFDLYDQSPLAWAPLTAIGVFVYFHSKHEVVRLYERDPQDGIFGYDFSQGYTSLERKGEGVASARLHRPGFVRRWLETRRAARLVRQRQKESDDERRVDEILARLHETGINALSDEERALLDRVSERYRNR